MGFDDFKEKSWQLRRKFVREATNTTEEHSLVLIQKEDLRAFELVVTGNGHDGRYERTIKVRLPMTVADLNWLATTLRGIRVPIALPAEEVDKCD